jgi:hypothetical protein
VNSPGLHRYAEVPDCYAALPAGSSPRALLALSQDEYRASLVNDPKKAEAAYEKAWDARKFEIELYWKRAAYFWAFIATTFVGYFALQNSANYKAKDRLNHAEVYFVICIGFVLSCAWLFINRGSKAWQRHWEVHVDLLEDAFVGPLYKTVNANKTFSVSKINEIISFVFVCVWLLLGVKFLIDQDLVNLNFGGINWLIVGATVLAIGAVFAMMFGHGRGRFADRTVVMYRRSFTYVSSTNEKNIDEPTVAHEATASCEIGD